MLCNDLEGWDREDGREAQEGGDTGTCVCIWLISFVVQQKLTQYCEAILLQKRAIKKENKNWVCYCWRMNLQIRKGWAARRNLVILNWNL